MHHAATASGATAKHQAESRPTAAADRDHRRRHVPTPMRMSTAGLQLLSASLVAAWQFRVAVLGGVASTMLAVGGSPAPLPRSLLSHTLGDGMVLQRAPQAARLFGFAPAGTTVTTTFGERTLGPSTADSSGTWRQDLPPTAAGGPHDLTVSASTGQNATLHGVLFGDVFVCGG